MCRCNRQDWQKTFSACFCQSSLLRGTFGTFFQSLVTPQHHKAPMVISWFTGKRSKWLENRDLCSSAFFFFFFRMFGGSGQCLHCNQIISAGEMCVAFKERYIHLQCLTCYVCQQPLNTGAKISYQGTCVLCLSCHKACGRSVQKEAGSRRRKSQPLSSPP